MTFKEYWLTYVLNAKPNARFFTPEDRAFAEAAWKAAKEDSAQDEQRAAPSEAARPMTSRVKVTQYRPPNERSGSLEFWANHEFALLVQGVNMRDAAEIAFRINAFEGAQPRPEAKKLPWPDNLTFTNEQVRPFTMLLAEYQSAHEESSGHDDENCDLCNRYEKMDWNLFLPPSDELGVVALKAKLFPEDPSPASTTAPNGGE